VGEIMNDVPRNKAFRPSSDAAELDGWSKLIALAEMVEINQLTGALTIRNGKSSLILRKDGQIIVEGVAITQRAERRIALDAAVIDLN
jgi:hypothetical protein